MAAEVGNLLCHTCATQVELSHKFCVQCGCELDCEEMFIRHYFFKGYCFHWHSSHTCTSVGDKIYIFPASTHHRICKTLCSRFVVPWITGRTKYSRSRTLSRAYKSAGNYNLWAHSFLWARNRRSIFYSKFYFSVRSFIFLFKVLFFCSKFCFCFNFFFWL